VKFEGKLLIIGCGSVSQCAIPLALRYIGIPPKDITIMDFVDNRARVKELTFTFHFHALEKEMATHSSVLSWRIPGTGEPGGLPSMGSNRVGHD